MSRIVLGVAGGIAAYKACELLRRLTEAGHDVTVVPTAAALEFVGRATWEALSGKPVRTGVFEGAETVPHVRIGRDAELVVVAPATADLLARAAHGRADDLLTNVLLTATCPVIMAPAMHTEMWQHPATRANVATLRGRGTVVVDPASGRLTGADSGPGRLPEPAELADLALAVLAEPALAAPLRARDLAGRTVLVDAGGTREPLDPVRFVGNASSGRMGLAIAAAAASRGARVELVAANVDLAVPAGVTATRVRTTAELAAAMRERLPRADVAVFAAAPADFTPLAPAHTKIKKSGADGLTVELVQTEDVLAAAVRARRPGQVVVGFAAETAGSPERLAELARAKRDRKGCDLLVANDVSGGAVFGAADNAVLIISAGGSETASGGKLAVAHHILSSATHMLDAPASPSVAAPTVDGSAEEGAV